MVRLNWFCFVLILAFATTSSAAPRTEPLSGNDRYIAGGIVGSILGLGVGHGIQGRYMNKGLIFTITEGVSIALIIVGAVAVRPASNAGGIAMIVVGALGLAGFKIWEIVDVWTGPYYANTAELPDLMHQNGYALSMVQNTSSMSNSMLQGGLTFRF